MHQRRRCFSLLAAGAVLVAATSARPALAQRIPSQAARPSFGVLVGLNLANFHGSEVSGTDSRTGVMGGVSGTFRFSRVFGIQPEVLFEQKGTKISEAGADATIKLSYIEIPVFARVEFTPNGGSVRPFLLAGPTLAFKVGCSLGASALGASTSLGCDSPLIAEAFGPGLNLNPGSVDAGAAVGGGLDILMGTWAMSLGVRYDQGLVSLFDGLNAKNKAVSLVAGVYF
ncbi:MAG TPA: porin family protein [Gemmatimonadaceae bacterium]|nr:porin family protein [Gemmatimonadaceae bacterium]